MSRRAAQRVLTSVVATVVCVISLDLTTRLFVTASATAFGTFMGLELPPVRLAIHAAVPKLLDPSAPNGISDSSKLVRGDLWGHFRLDPSLGYTYQEHVTSKNGWWQSNNLGARSRMNVERRVMPGRTRVLVFGESFAQGSRLPQEQAWPTVLQDRDGTLDVLNFAVDGYSMGQSLLRYRQIRERLDYDFVVLMFAPEADLVRDVNTLRQLQDPRLDMPLMPRFILRGDALALVPPLYADPFDLYRRNGDHTSPELREYLRAFDRLYFPSKYDASSLLGASMFAKLLARARWTAQERAVQSGFMNAGSEALRVSRAIFESMQQQALADGASFALVILPIEDRWLTKTVRTEDMEAWNEMVSFICAQRLTCVDLLPAFRAVPRAEVDRALDGWHFGPGMNRRIADWMEQVVKVSEAQKQ